MTNVQERSRTRRQRVLDAALEVFTQHGYGDTAVDEIARVSDTSKGGLYFHFPSKQALFLALLDEASVALLRASKSRWRWSPIPFYAATPRCVKCCTPSRATASWRGCSSSKHSERGIVPPQRPLFRPDSLVDSERGLAADARRLGTEASLNICIPGSPPPSNSAENYLSHGRLRFQFRDLPSH